MDATPKAPAGRRRRTWTVRTRVLALNLAVILTGLLVAGAVTFGVQFAQLNQRIEDEFKQEINELTQVMFLGPNRDGNAYDDVHALFRAYLQNSLPANDEWMMTWVDEDPAPALLVPGGDPP